MLGVVAASNSASLVTKAIFRTIESEPFTTSITLPGTSGNSRPHAASHVSLPLSPPTFRSATTEAIVMSFCAAARSAAAGRPCCRAKGHDDCLRGRGPEGGRRQGQTHVEIGRAHG